MITNTAYIKHIMKIVILSILYLSLLSCSTNQEKHTEDFANQLSSNNELIVTDSIIYLRRYSDQQFVEFLINAGENNIDYEFALTSLKDKVENELLPATNELESNDVGDYLVNAQGYFLNNEYRRALAEINKAIRQLPKSYLSWALKGSIHFKRKENGLARQSWKRALKLNPNSQRVKEMLDYIGD